LKYYKKGKEQTTTFQVKMCLPVVKLKDQNAEVFGKQFQSSVSEDEEAGGCILENEDDDYY
jgi:hypothetical protein